MDTHKSKRGRDGDEDDPWDGFEMGHGVYKRHCSGSGISELWGLDEQDFELGEHEEDMVFACNEPQVFGVLREETADSESSSSKVYYNSEDFSPPFCRSSSSGYFPRFPLPDDAQSSTSDSCCCCCCDTSDDDDDEEEEEDDDDDEGNEGESSASSSSASSSLPASDSTQNFISYLYEASDDDLGLPPALCTSYDDCKNDDHHCQSKVLEKHAQELDLDLDLDLDVDLDLDFDLDLVIEDDHLLGWDL